MKVKNLVPKTFKPIKLEVTIESIQELIALYHRLNAGKLDDDYMQSYDLTSNKVCNTLTMQLYNAIAEEYHRLTDTRSDDEE